MSTYKLHYFNGRGRAEPARLVFAAASQNFEDIRYEAADWPSHKAEMPLGQIPVLEVDGVKLPQSLAIARFLAKQFQLAGKDNFEQAIVDAVLDTIGDLCDEYGPIREEPDAVKQQADMKKFFKEGLPKHLTNLETLVKVYGNGGPFFVGNHLTLADLVQYTMVEYLLEFDSNLFINHPLLKCNREEVEKQPKIAAYLKTRPETPW